MPKTKISEFDVDPANNTDINSINIAEGCAPSGINNAIRQLMSDLKEFQTGAGGDPFNGAVNGTVGATTPASGAFTTLSASGAFSANGGATLGDASGDALTINSSAVSIPNGLNFGSNNLVLSSGNVGIGTSSPVSIAGYTIQTLNNGTSGSGTYYQQAATSIGRVLVTATEMYVGSNGAYPLILTTNAAERMRIDSSGNVGIGTSSPTERLVIVNTSSTAEMQLRGGTTAANYSQIGLYGGSTRNAEVSSNSAFLTLDHQNSGVINFRTGGSERMRIDSSGNLLVGTTNATSNSGVGIKFVQSPTDPFVAVVASTNASGSTAYNLYSTATSSYRFYVSTSGTISAVNTTISSLSDQRHKENIRDLDVGIEEIMALKPRKFDWKEGKGKDIKGDRGFIAQEFEQVFPELIDEWKDPAPEGEEPYKSVRADLIPVLVKAMQEQQAIINDLKARIETLESK